MLVLPSQTKVDLDCLNKIEKLTDIEKLLAISLQVVSEEDLIKHGFNHEKVAPFLRKLHDNLIFFKKEEK